MNARKQYLEEIGKEYNRADEKGRSRLLNEAGMRVVAIRHPRLVTAAELSRHRIRAGERLLFKTRNSSTSWKGPTFASTFVTIAPDAAPGYRELRLRSLLGLSNPIRFGVGVNGGEVVVGDVGYGERAVFTAMGDAVNVAARLQDMTKDLECEAVVSEEVFGLAALAADAFAAREVAIRGRDRPIHVRVIERAIALSTATGAPARDGSGAPAAVGQT